MTSKQEEKYLDLKFQTMDEKIDVINTKVDKIIDTLGVLDAKFVSRKEYEAFQNSTLAKLEENKSNYERLNGWYLWVGGATAAVGTILAFFSSKILALFNGSF